MRRLIAILVAMAALAAFVTPAAAVQPTRTPENLEAFLFEGLCGFDVQLDVLVDRSYAVDYYDRDGNLVRTQYHGSIVLRLTNTDTGSSLDLNVGGPARDTYNPDGTITTVFLGLGLPLATNTNATRGRFEFTYSADFSEVIGVGDAHGFTEDICPMLA
jgi:hypothetical protein